jgi:XTP/dITP diphosphohydrolase
VGRVDRVDVVTWSPRVPAGVLALPAWDALRSGPVRTADPDTPQAAAVRAAGVDVRALPADRPGDLRELARGGVAVWLAGPDGDPGLLRALTDRADDGFAVEVVAGSWDPPGGHLLDVVAVMDRLRSPGGCPWDAEQTHRTLAPYLLEESYELLEAIEEDDHAHLREELGDVLLQVAFHARLAEERPGAERFSIDDVAADLVAKLVRRHPHVFAGRQVDGAAEVVANWDQIKAEEKRRESVTDGVPLGQPALALAAKLRRRADKAGLAVPPPTDPTPDGAIGARLLAVVADAVAADVDPEAALRATARAYRDALRTAEGLPPAAGRPAAGGRPAVTPPAAPGPADA